MTCVADYSDAVDWFLGTFPTSAVLLQGGSSVLEHRLDLVDLLDALEMPCEVLPVLDQSDPVSVTHPSL